MNWSHLRNITENASKKPLQVASSPHPLRRAWSQFKACSQCPAQNEASSAAFTAAQVSGLNEIAINLPSVSVLNEIAHVKNFPYSDKIGSSHVHLHRRHLGRLFSQSVIRLKFTKRQSVSESVSELVSDKHSQWSDSGPIKSVIWSYQQLGALTSSASPFLRFDPSFFSVWERVRAGHLGHVQMIKVESQLIRQWNR